MSASSLAQIPVGQGLHVLVVLVVFIVVNLILRQIRGINCLFQRQKIRLPDQLHFVLGAVIGPSQLALVQVIQKPL